MGTKDRYKQPGPAPGNAPGEDRRARQAEALRANLRRRKAALQRAGDSGASEADANVAAPDGPDTADGTGNRGGR